MALCRLILKNAPKLLSSSCMSAVKFEQNQMLVQGTRRSLILSACSQNSISLRQIARIDRSCGLERTVNVLFNYQQTYGLHTTAVCGTRKNMYVYGKEKRRKRHRFWWQMKPEWEWSEEYLSPESQQFIHGFIENKYKLKPNESPLKEQPWDQGEWDRKKSIRTGLICRKIGIYPMWTNSGKRIQNTLLQVVDNHVIKYYPHDEYMKICRPYFHWRAKRNGRRLAAIVVGAESTDPQRFSSEYLGLFKESGVMPKKKLTKFHITEDAALQPGTPLHATHFRPGMFVNIWAKSRDWGFRGVRKRWHFRGGPKTHGNCKNHNRTGTIGRGRKHPGPLKGKKMPGHMGNERIFMRNLKIWRINTQYNVLFVTGQAIPGKNGNYVYVMDSWLNRELEEPPFPTHFPEQDSEPMAEELFDKEMHKFDEPTIVYIETEEERKAAAAAARMLGRAKTAQKRR